jgi:DNA-binding beta-propeller fold protein YncE
VLTANDNGTALPVQTLRNGVLHNVVVISGNQRLSCLPHGRTAYIYGGNDNTVSATALTVGTVPIELAPTPVGEPNIVINSYAAEAGGNSLAPVSAWGACGRNGAVLSTYVDSGIRGVIINPSSCKAF